MASNVNKKARKKASAASAGLQPDPVRVAIVGGGCAGLAAAWQLARRGYKVDVYEKSWRLGGKGASGRDADGRICEHGLHIWLGFYDNAFRMMRECYAEVESQGWGPDAKQGERLAHGSLLEAFFPEPHIGVAVRHAGEPPAQDPGRRWDIWSGHLPPAKGLPGDPLDADTNPFTVANYLVRCYELLKTLMLSAVEPAGKAPAQAAPDLQLAYALDPARTPGEIVEWSARVLRGTVVSAASILLQVVRVVQMLLKGPGSAPPLAGMRTFQLITALLEQARKLLSEVVATAPVLRHKLEIIDIVITIAVGLYRDRLLFQDRGFDAINGIDYKKWLCDHGASRQAVDSAFITGIYDLTFACHGGTRQLAAGVALRGALRMFFTYRGAMFWRMRSGMGDAVFAPLYKVLLRKGVVFHFLHALDKVEMERVGPQRFVKRLQFRTAGKPAALDAQSSDALDHFGCWPEEARQQFPAAGEWTNGPTVERITDFDAVILATGAEDFVTLGDHSQLFAQLPRKWKDMRDHVRTAATQSAQAWLAADLEELGWQRGSGIMTALGAPYDTWADMTHTLETEAAWRAARARDEGKDPVNSPHDAARSVAYFCGVVPDGGAQDARAAMQRAESDAERLLTRGIQPFWPAAFEKGGTAKDLLVQRWHVQANWRGSDRYTLALPESVRHRVSPLDRSVANMTIAGDWTASGLDAGCVEAAVMSGMLAAVAISGDGKLLDSIVGYDHP